MKRCSSFAHTAGSPPRWRSPGVSKTLGAHRLAPVRRLETTWDTASSPTRWRAQTWCSGSIALVLHIIFLCCEPWESCIPHLAGKEIYDLLICSFVECRNDQIAKSTDHRWLFLRSRFPLACSRMWLLILLSSSRRVLPNGVTVQQYVRSQALATTNRRRRRRRRAPGAGRSTHPRAPPPGRCYSDAAPLPLQPSRYSP